MSTMYDLRQFQMFNAKSSVQFSSLFYVHVINIAMSFLDFSVNTVVRESTVLKIFNIFIIVLIFQVFKFFFSIL